MTTTTPATDQQRLEQLFRAEHPCVSITTFEEDEALALVRAAADELRLDLLIWSVAQGLRDGMIADGPTITGTEHPAAALIAISDMPRKVTVVMLDLAEHLKDERTMRCLREAISAVAKKGGHLVLIDHSTNAPACVRAVATQFELSLPDEPALEQIVKDTLRQRNAVCRISVEISKTDLQAIVRNLRGLTRRQARQVVLDTVCEDRRFDVNDVHMVLAQKRKHLQGVGLLDFVEAPTSIDEIGGLRRMKFWLEQRRTALNDEAKAFGITPPRGVLMLGVQGAGKSLAAKAVATAWQRPLLRMDVSALYDKFIGESERRLRDALHQAEMMAPIILWIDEIEKAFASAASQSSDGGLSKRMFGTLLTWMQEHEAPVFLIATANDIEALPPELLRKGRFDEIFFVDLPDAEARQMIFAIHLRKRGRDPKKFDLAKLAQVSEGHSGAEIEQAIKAALYSAFAHKQELIDQHLIDAIHTSPPLSVTMAEKIEDLRNWATGRCVPAD
ncbi:MAG TPA: AAA family ATPase [Tepidisphaeraceae bacterium]|nr:AAA family ATPase [Tepidisphaeraceae bacterium]